jgi:hypothetical protein
MSNNPPPSTPLTRFGPHVPIVQPAPNGKATAKANAKQAKQQATRTTGSAPQAQTTVRPQPTIRAMIIALPDHLPNEARSAHSLDRHFGVSGTLQPRFWASPAATMWQRRQLIGLRPGRPAYCAGGPLRLLNLAGMRDSAGHAAAMRFQHWARVVHRTGSAKPWHQFLTRHLADPATYTLADARTAFGDQPRVLDIRMHNAATYGAAQLDESELEMVQAGPMAYQHYRACTALTGDAVLTADGHTIKPASDAMQHRVTFLQQAMQYLAALEPTRRLIAVTL